MAKKAKAKTTKKAAKAARTRAKTAKTAKKAAKAKKGARTPARGAKRAAKKTAAKKTVVTKTAKKAKKAGPARATAKKSAARQTSAGTAAKKPAAPGKRPNLDRERRTIQEDVHGVPSSLDLDRTASAARTGRHEFEERLREHTSTGPAMTGGDVDADWEDAESVGEEAPGGDNPTPDQDVVDEIGKALGIEYDDDEELQGGDEVAERDRHRWELDPRSKDEFEEE